MSDQKRYLMEEVAPLLQQLDPSTKPAFGLMTAQHMVEHISGSLGFASKRSGEPENPPTENQLKFQAYLATGPVIKHRPSDKTSADLPPLKMDSMEAAVALFQPAIDAFYAHYEAHPDFKPYAPFMGELDFETIQNFIYEHTRYHLWQFGLLESYP